MQIGGSTTSLLSLLNEIDYSKYDIDLLLLNRSGSLMSAIPEQVHILDSAYNSRLPYKIRKRLSVKNFYYVAKCKNENQRGQYIANSTVSYCRRIEKKYDIGIAFLECWPTYYLIRKINSEKKICWIHVNYSEAGFNSRFDTPYYAMADRIVLVSDSCHKDFVHRFPQFMNKACHIPNLLSKKYIRRRAELNSSMFDWSAYKSQIKFVSVCRIDFAHKGLDRALAAFYKLVKERVDNFVWVVIGDGPDYEEMQERIKKYRLERKIYMLGSNPNPLSTLVDADIFLLPSRYEGKPMAVTEAQMLGIVPLVTSYSSAEEQIEKNVDGIICENSDNGIYIALKEVLIGKSRIQEMKDNVKNREYSNLNDLSLIEQILEE